MTVAMVVAEHRDRRRAPGAPAHGCEPEPRPMERRDRRRTSASSRSRTHARHRGHARAEFPSRVGAGRDLAASSAPTAGTSTSRLKEGTRRRALVRDVARPGRAAAFDPRDGVRGRGVRRHRRLRAARAVPAHRAAAAPGRPRRAAAGSSRSSSAGCTAEGLFDAARKRPLPPLPARIGVVTSPERRGGARHRARCCARAGPAIGIVLAPVRCRARARRPRSPRRSSASTAGAAPTC